jgi:hypothetical protein
MATQIERDTPDPQEEQEESEHEDELDLTDDGGFARLELPGVEPTED